MYVIYFKKIYDFFSESDYYSSRIDTLAKFEFEGQNFFYKCCPGKYIPKGWTYFSTSLNINFRISNKLQCSANYIILLLKTSSFTSLYYRRSSIIGTSITVILAIPGLKYYQFHVLNYRNFFTNTSTQYLTF